MRPKTRRTQTFTLQRRGGDCVVALRGGKSENLLFVFGLWLIEHQFVTSRRAKVRIRLTPGGLWCVGLRVGSGYYDVYHRGEIVGAVCKSRWLKVTGIRPRVRFSVERVGGA